MSLGPFCQRCNHPIDLEGGQTLQVPLEASSLDPSVTIDITVDQINFCQRHLIEHVRLQFHPLAEYFHIKGDQLGDLNWEAIYRDLYCYERHEEHRREAVKQLWPFLVRIKRMVSFPPVDCWSVIDGESGVPQNPMIEKIPVYFVEKRDAETWLLILNRRGRGFPVTIHIDRCEIHPYLLGGTPLDGYPPELSFLSES